MKHYEKLWLEELKITAELKRSMRELECEGKRIKTLERFNDTDEEIIFIGERKSQRIIVTQLYEYNGYTVSKIYIRAYPDINADIHKPVCELYACLFFDDEAGTMLSTHICDFTTAILYRDKGIGSLVLQKFVDFAVKCGVSSISGCLSHVDEQDENNRQRRNHVYEKFGFTIDGEYVRMEI
jgi:ribosomal protein S18 acetylase RimI-like enzyme